jgi:hypothetical protein
MSSSTAFEVVPAQKSPAPAVMLKVKQDSTAIEIDTGVITCRVPRKGDVCIETLRRGGSELLLAGLLVVLRQDAPMEQGDVVIRQETFEGQVEDAVVEHSGPIRAVVKIAGKIAGLHSHASGRRWLPFTLRLYFYAGGDDVRLLQRSFLMAMRCATSFGGSAYVFDVPLTDKLHDRHVRFAGESDGIFGVMALRRSNDSNRRRSPDPRC